MAKEKRAKKPKRKLAVIDFETDPFKHGRKPKAFCAGFYDGEIYREFWGDDCALQLVCFLETLESPYTIYAHNGGKFDFYYLLELGVLTNPALVIHGRLTKVGLIGRHELRDSYSIIPIPLSAYIKDEIDYRLMERDVRQKHKKEILKYLKSDCVYLFDLVSKFRERFGPKLTVGATAISQLGKFHYVSRQDERHDEAFRKYYFGGRVECFESGELVAPDGSWKIYDVNSMYPKAMRDFDHPSGKSYIHLGREASKFFNYYNGDMRGFTGMYFMRFIGTNKNALPVRITEGPKKGGLRFDQTYGEFYACSHEIKAAIQLGLVKVLEILDVYIPCTPQRFKEYVDHWMAEKIKYKNLQKTDPENATSHKAEETFAKLMLNSAYGKYATDPRSFKDWFILDTWDENVLAEFEEWRANTAGTELANDLGRYELWTAPSYDIRGFYDVAVAASITSAARSILLRAIHASTRPLYCDTDSLICLDIGNVPIDDAALGAWKFEGSTQKIYIAAKKIYSCELNERGKDGKVKYKQASKGAKLTHDDIVKLCRGESVIWNSDAPNFKLNGETKFVSRKIVKNT